MGFLLLTGALPAQQRNIDDFFRDFTADWVRHDPNTATFSRYFTDDELLLSIRQQSQTVDESVHIFSGYRYWKPRDFGANPGFSCLWRGCRSRTRGET